MLKPVFTEKSLKAAKEGKYTFWVGRNMNKGAIKSEVGSVFGVHVISIKTITVSGEHKKNQKGKKITVMGRKKAIVTLKDKEKINIFEEKK
ncbi:MAG: 50S ribosomal protein L23 [Candidatus Woesebacteria bacterium GW2011_GWB1_45_5]|uniref:50S ribosomal protein L23 n=1 Tax=Candidatus Woesebacteria bacterium GW2011_GWB1_45_5 TaxID=1618581 RepID=A0A0G1MMC4_9BACT|nr:MAG: 50S ribosomal protein L23 [Candidatus Woesebacteria bacterium GW2011_GWB1_45_5]